MRFGQDMRLSFLLLTVAMCLLAVSGVEVPCAVPQDGGIYSSDTILCKGDYRLTQGITIQGEGAVFDCNNSILIGSYRNVGIKITGKDNVLKNCDIRTYEIGAQFAESTRSTLKDSRLTHNVNAVSFVQSNENKIYNVAVDQAIKNVDMVSGRYNTLWFNNIKVRDQPYCTVNACDQAEMNPCVSGDGYCGSVCSAQEDAECIGSRPTIDQAVGLYRETAVEQIQAKVPDKADKVKELIAKGRIELKESEDSERAMQIQSVLRKLNLSPTQYKEMKNKVNVTKYAYVTENQTLFEITVIALKPVTDMVLYEYFPERFTDLASNASKGDHLEFEIGKIEVGGKAELSYKAESDALLKGTPVSIPVDLGGKYPWLNWVIGYVLAFFGIQTKKMLSDR